MRRRFATLLATGALVAGAAPVLLTVPASAASAFPAGFTDTTVAGSLGSATALAQLPDGRFLVTSQNGVVHLVQGNSASVAIDLNATADGSHPAVCSNSEEGLLGVTVDNQFASNGFIYLYYTRSTGSCANGTGGNPGGAVNRVSRFTLTGATLARSSEHVLLDNMPEWGGNHNGGYVHVAHDGTLFVSVGDGGAGRPDSNPANLSLPNGKILRINTDGSIPAGNPHGTTQCGTTWGTSGTTCGEIYADGLRNPFRLAFRDDVPGVQFRINDVGDATWEEVDEGAAGAHYGWPCREGPDPHGSSAQCTPPITDPTYWYNHSTTCNVITAGAFVPAGVWQGFDDAYLFADNGCGRMWVAQPGTSGPDSPVLATGLAQITDMAFFKQNGSYALFYMTYADGGQLHKVIGPAAIPPPTVQSTKFSALQPTRVLDTRNGTGVGAGKLAAKASISLKVTGGNVPDTAKAVVLNLTATLADGPGFVTVWPTGQPQPTTSSLNLSAAGETAANAVVVPVGTGGQVNLFTFAGTHLVADVTGYFSDAGGSIDGRFHATAGPTRVLDTRTGVGGKTGPFTPGQSFDLAVAGQGGVPSDAAAVALTVTYTGPTAPGYLTVWPTGQPQPVASTTNPNGPGDIRSNLAMIPVGTGGKVSIFSFAQTDVVVDVVGWFGSGSGTAGLFTAVGPERVADSRQTSSPFGRINGGSEATLDLSTFVTPGSTGALYNLTATNTVAGGYLTAHPAGTALPLASSVNWSGPGQDRAALTITSLASSNKIGLFALTTADAVVDLAGFFSA